DIDQALKYLTNVIKKRCTTFIISDFLDKKFSDSIKLANKKHDLIVLQLYDRHDEELPKVGDLKVLNPETGKEIWVDTSSQRVQKVYKKWWIEHNQFLNETFMRSGVDYVKLRTDIDYVKPLVQLFKRR
ncbi:MAG: DUF58 domain-containing protein, partial [Bacteroidales bacterium]|nr:DUF58 domain-containing protein [Bacteroidales bacterium]